MFILAAVPLASNGSVFKGADRGQKNSLKPSQGLNLKPKQPKTHSV